MPIDVGKIAWVSSEGGPLILIAANDLLSWGGVTPPQDGHSIKAKFRWAGANSPATDYDRACDIDEAIGLVQVGAGVGLVLSEGVLPTGWWEASSGQGLLVQGGYTDEEEFILSELANIPDNLWKTTLTQFIVPDAPLYLFDASFPGTDVEGSGDYLTLRLPPGNHTVESVELKIEGIYIAVFRFDKHD